MKRQRKLVPVLAAVFAPALACAPEEPTTLDESATSTTLDPPVGSVSSALTAEEIQKAFPPEIQELVNQAGEFIKVYNAVAPGVGVVVKFLEMTGIIGSEADQIDVKFKALEAKLDSVAERITSQEEARARQVRLSNGFSAVTEAGQWVQAYGKLPFGENPQSESLRVVDEAKVNSAFKRYYEDNDSGMANWKEYISDRADHSDGFAYDWRYGVPALMQLISLRLQVIAAMDPHFIESGVFQKELLQHRKALLDHHAKMVAGVRCINNARPLWEDGNIASFGQIYSLEIACAEIHIGFAHVRQFQVPYYQVNDATLKQLQHDQELMRDDILDRMPLRAMTAMAAQLLRYSGLHDRIALTGGLVGDASWGTVPMATAVGNGNFSVTNGGAWPFSYYATLPGASPLAGDFNGDGRRDVALIGGYNWGTIPVAFARDDGTFATTNSGVELLPVLARGNPKAVAGDFNGDGLADIALTGGDGWGSIPVAYSQGNGNFTITNAAVEDFPIWATHGATPVAGDFNGDGLADIALVGVPGWGTIPVAFSLGNGTFRVTNSGVYDFPYYSTLEGARPVAGDFDGDGRDDLALTGGTGWGTIPVARSLGTGDFLVSNGAAPGFAGRAAEAGADPVTLDIDNDGRSEIAVTGGLHWVPLLHPITHRPSGSYAAPRTSIAVAKADQDFWSSQGAFNTWYDPEVPDFAGWATHSGAMVVGAPGQRTP